MSMKNVSYNMDAAAMPYGAGQQAEMYTHQELEKMGGVQQNVYDQPMIAGGTSSQQVGAYSTKSSYTNTTHLTNANSGAAAQQAYAVQMAGGSAYPVAGSGYQQTTTHQQSYSASPAATYSQQYNTQAIPVSLQYGTGGGVSQVQHYSTGAAQVIPGQQYVTQQYSTGQYPVAASMQQQNYGASMHTTTSSSAAVAAAAASGRYKSETRVIGKEYGEERVISVTQRVDESRTHIVGERYVEHEVRVPKRIVREEIIEKVIVVPEKVIQEEIIEDMAKVQEKIIEVARPIIIEKVVEVPEYEYVEKIIEVPEVIKQERLKHVEKVEYQDRIQEVVKVIPQERVVEVPDVQYRDVPVERVVEVPEWRDEIVYREIPVPQYVDKPVPNVVQSEQARDVERTIPIPVEANITYEFRIPKIKPRYHKISYPVYLPRFIEVPVALELLQGGLLQQTETYLQQVGLLTKAAASLCEIENLATSIMKADIQTKVSTMDLQSLIMKSWKEGTLNISSAGGLVGLGGGVTTSTSHQYTSTTTQYGGGASYGGAGAAYGASSYGGAAYGASTGGGVTYSAGTGGAALTSAYPAAMHTSYTSPGVMLRQAA